MKTRAVISCVYLGFISQVAQIIILREALTAFSGVEITVGLTLCVWLLAVACGGFTGNTLTLFHRRPFPALRTLYILSGLLLPITVLALRRIPPMFGYTAGELVSAATTLAGTSLTITPLCFVLGLLFAANARVYREHAVGWVGRVYLWEALGAAAGGLIVTFIFIPFWSHLGAAAAMLLFGVLVAGWLGRRWLRGFVPSIVGMVVLWFLHLGSPSVWHTWDMQSRGLDREVGRLVAVVDSPYSQLAVTRYGEQHSLYINGTLAVSYPDRLTAEEAVHFAALSHPAPQNALLIGGGSGGAISELLKNDVQVDYLELDPAVIRLVTAHFPRAATAALDSCRMIHADGREYLARDTAVYDLIILNLGEPSSALVNRYFTNEFFVLVRNRLAAGGIFSFRMPSSESYISPERAQFLSSLYTTLEGVFPELVVLPGSHNIFLAAVEPDILITTAEEFSDRIARRELHNQFINEYLLPYRLTPAAYEFLQPYLHVSQAKANTDLRPVCYFYDAVLWNTQFRGPQKWLLSRLADLKPGYLWLFFGLGIIAVFGWNLAVRRRNRGVFLFSLLITGFTGLAMEVLLLVGFQVYLGVMYGKIGLLIACFMIGMSLGGFAITRRAKYTRGLLIGFHVLPAILAVLLMAVPGIGEAGRLPPLVLEFVFYLLSTVFGFFGGALFVLANGLYLKHAHHGRTVPVATGYAVDLLGSALGALIVSSMLIPVWGILSTLLLLAALNAAVVVLIAVMRIFGNGGNVI